MSDPVHERWRRLAASPLDNRIDAVCDEFEQEWIAGGLPDLNQYLAFLDVADRAVLFRELVQLDIEYRRHRRLPVDRSAYLARFPDYAEELDTVVEVGPAKSPAGTTAAIPTPPRAGQCVGRFELIDCVHSGAGGDVWKAYDPVLRRHVAVKIVLARSDEELQRFVREGQAVAQLRHPHIVTVHDAWGGEGTAYIVTNFYEGDDLKLRLARDCLAPREAAQSCAALAEALHYAHDCGVIHRALNPAKILLDADGEPHIADFGLTNWADDARNMRLDGQLLGVVAYMSPEQARGESERVDRRTDVYSLGVMLYEMLSGACPFVGDHASVLHAIAVDNPVGLRELDRSIPIDLETICLKAMDREIDRRYPTAGELGADLRRYLRGDPILARRRHALARAWRYVSRRPAWFACLKLSLAIVSALAAVQVLHIRK